MKRIKIFIIAAFVLVCHSCDNFLDVVPDDVATLDMAFNTRASAEKYLVTCYSYVPLFGAQRDNPGLTSGNDIWYYTDQDNFFDNKWTFGIATGYQNTLNPLVNCWDGGNGAKSLFQAIRDCNIFLEYVTIPGRVPDLKEDMRIRWVAEVKTLKAFYHYYLFLLYGPIPITDKNLPVTATPEEVRVYRDKVDDVVKYICDLIDDAVEDLPLKIANEATEMGRLTKSAALGIKAKTLILSASPLFNGNSDYANFKDPRDNQPFVNQTFDRNKWVIAADACKDAIDVALEGGHEFYDFDKMSGITVSEKLSQSLRVRGAVTERFNKELIWGCGKSYTADLQNHCQPKLLSEHSAMESTCRGMFAPTFESVELFYTRNGVPMEEDKDWILTSRFNERYNTANSNDYQDDVDSKFIKSNYTTALMHFDREPRFYGSVGFDGSSWFGCGKTDESDGLFYMEAKRGQISGKSILALYSITGYYTKKLVNFRNVLRTGTIAVEEYPFPIIRLADLYLLYAEALLESTDSQTAVPDEVYTYVDEVRRLSGLKGVVESWRDHAVNSQKPLTRSGMLDIVKRERQIELAFEGQRYHDMRRWKQAYNTYNTTIKGWSVDEESTDEYYVVKNVYYMTYRAKDYLWPIKDEVIIKNSNIVQNPGW